MRQRLAPGCGPLNCPAALPGCTPFLHLQGWRKHGRREGLGRKTVLGGALGSLIIFPSYCMLASFLFVGISRSLISPTCTPVASPPRLRGIPQASQHLSWGAQARGCRTRVEPPAKFPRSLTDLSRTWGLEALAFQGGAGRCFHWSQLPVLNSLLLWLEARGDSDLSSNQGPPIFHNNNNNNDNKKSSVFSHSVFSQARLQHWKQSCPP